MNYWKVILATVVIFGTGVVTGGLLVDITQRDLFAIVVHHAPSAPGNQVAASTTTTNSSTDARTVAVNSAHSSDVLTHRLGLIQKMDTLLKLSPEQHEAIQKIITNGQGEMNKVMQDTFQNVRDQLTPEQQKKYEDMLKQFHSQTHAVSSLITNHYYISDLPPGSVTPKRSGSAI